MESWDSCYNKEAVPLYSNLNKPTQNQLEYSESNYFFKPSDLRQLHCRLI